jgi:hypothetical protein
LVRAYRARDGTTVACVLRTGTRTVLDFPPYLRAYPAISIVGPFVALGLEGQADPNMQEDGTFIAVLDARTGEQPPRFGAPFAVKHPGAFDGKVGSVVVKRSGGLAWIACRTPFNRVEDYGNPRPSCVRPGAYDEVHKLDAGEPVPRQLDRGRRIDPGSLRRRGDTIFWTTHRHRREATLR